MSGNDLPQLDTWHAASGSSSTSAPGCRWPATPIRWRRRSLDFGAPVALMLLIILHLIPDDDDPYGIVAELMGALTSGSHLVLAHPASDIRAAGSSPASRSGSATTRT